MNDRSVPNNPHGVLQDEVIRLFYTPRPRVVGFFADIPADQRHKYVIPPPPPDETDGQESRVWGSAASETTPSHGGHRRVPQDTEGRRQNTGSQTPGTAEKMCPQVVLESDVAREERLSCVESTSKQLPRSAHSGDVAPLDNCQWSVHSAAVSARLDRLHVRTYCVTP
ncbi:hypothetical protein HPB51_026071 [Rhipicephalus microplus]|uniref:Uncharacterized protein n=1 Tax=Rhipicephalus microplus TaxID=6941 RepID=A0A9J6EE88_RHIMP|nr:hypothetical protein HPB51_026071 [Rhipicephalus microplus]